MLAVNNLKWCTSCVYRTRSKSVSKSVFMGTHLRDMERHLPHGITVLHAI